MRPLLVSSGEPAGIGPDICLALAGSEIPVVVLGDLLVLKERANQLGQSIHFEEYQSDIPYQSKRNHLTVLSCPCATTVTPGQLNVHNASYVLTLLSTAIKRCLNDEFSGIVTAPVHKAIINQAGFQFTGHTEFFAEQCQVEQVVMMLACEQLKVALVTTHVPLSEVATLITDTLLSSVLSILHQGLQQYFGLVKPAIYVAGLNPHAGESGYLGKEEIEIISPCIARLQQQGMQIHGPLSADTLFTPQFLRKADAFVAMFHDQGLPVLKYASFGQGINITLGLPIIRTSVDHGTALELAGTNLADPGSLLKAVEIAAHMVKNKNDKN